MVIQKARFISIFINEVTITDCQSWLGVHVYCVDGWKRNPILLSLDQLVNGGIADNLTNIIVDNVLQYGGLSKFDLVSKFISCGVDGVSIFQGAKIGVTIQLWEKLSLKCLGYIGLHIGQAW
jgi:hypothetical protein